MCLMRSGWRGRSLAPSAQSSSLMPASRSTLGRRGYRSIWGAMPTRFACSVGQSRHRPLFPRCGRCWAACRKARPQCPLRRSRSFMRKWAMPNGMLERWTSPGCWCCSSSHSWSRHSVFCLFCILGRWGVPGCCLVLLFCFFTRMPGAVRASRGCRPSRSIRRALPPPGASGVHWF